MMFGVVGRLSNNRRFKGGRAITTKPGVGRLAGYRSFDLSATRTVDPSDIPPHHPHEEEKRKKKEEQERIMFSQFTRLPARQVLLILSLWAMLT
jgi:hypothetical protein